MFDIDAFKFACRSRLFFPWSGTYAQSRKLWYVLRIQVMYVFDDLCLNPSDLWPAALHQTITAANLLPSDVNYLLYIYLTAFTLLGLWHASMHYPTIYFSIKHKICEDIRHLIFHIIFPVSRNSNRRAITLLRNSGKCHKICARVLRSIRWLRIKNGKTFAMNQASCAVIQMCYLLKWYISWSKTSSHEWV